jgi:hypothetical protein
MWDFGTDPVTGDWLFGANRDLAGVDGVSLDRQRIRTRLKVTRGTFHYDLTGLLGSRLHVAQRLGIERAEREIPLLIREALEPMDDIEVRDIAVKRNENDPNQLMVELKYGHISGVSELALTEDETDEFSVTLSL